MSATRDEELNYRQSCVNRAAGEVDAEATNRIERILENETVPDWIVTELDAALKSLGKTSDHKTAKTSRKN